jgi:hypothetical protein
MLVADRSEFSAVSTDRLMWQIMTRILKGRAQITYCLRLDFFVFCVGLVAGRSTQR